MKYKKFLFILNILCVAENFNICFIYDVFRYYIIVSTNIQTKIKII